MAAPGCNYYLPTDCFLFCLQYLGSTPVEQPKGIEVVKEAIRRLQFTQQMKKAEGGGNVKTKKVEITISVDGVAIQVGGGSGLNEILTANPTSFRLLN